MIKNDKERQGLTPSSNRVTAPSSNRVTHPQSRERREKRQKEESRGKREALDDKRDDPDGLTRFE